MGVGGKNKGAMKMNEYAVERLLKALQSLTNEVQLFREQMAKTEPQTITAEEKTELLDAIGGEFFPKDEPQTDCGDFADRLAYERGVKHAWGVAQKVFDSTVTFYEAEDVAKQIADTPQTKVRYCNECKWFKNKQVCGRCRSRNLYAPKNEPQTDCAWR